MTLDDVKTMFGLEVYKVVKEMVKMRSDDSPFNQLRFAPEEYITEERLAILVNHIDKRALYIKLAERVLRLTTIYTEPEEIQRIVAAETLRFYVPLAQHLKVEKAVNDLQTKALEILNQGSKSSVTGY